MYRGKHLKKSQFSINNAMYRTVGILLTLTLLSVWLLCGLYAKYTVSENVGDSAGVAKGIEMLKVFEHKAELITDEEEAVEKGSVYKLLSGKTNEVVGYAYDVVLPGVDLPKDPFVRIVGEPEVTFKLYMRIVEKDIPETVTYGVTDDWKETSSGSKVYEYKDLIDSKIEKDIYILEDNEVKVSAAYEGEKFSLTFDAWLVQVD